MKPNFWAGMTIGMEVDHGSSDHSYYICFPINAFSEINDQTTNFKTDGF